jgi:hypothetical protein
MRHTNAMLLPRVGKVIRPWIIIVIRQTYAVGRFVQPGRMEIPIDNDIALFFLTLANKGCLLQLQASGDQQHSDQQRDCAILC